MVAIRGCPYGWLFVVVNTGASSKCFLLDISVFKIPPPGLPPTQNASSKCLLKVPPPKCHFLFIVILPALLPLLYSPEPHHRKSSPRSPHPIHTWPRTQKKHLSDLPVRLQVPGCTCTVRGALGSSTQLSQLEQSGHCSDR
eukprot:9504020-Pyramimonas_sp.AAC.2